MVMDNLNAMVGRNNRGYKEIIGQHGLGEMNGYAERLADFCASNRSPRRKHFPAQENI
jgi:hypothetical protein